MVALNGNGWHLAPCLATLVQQIDQKWPDRSRISDGTIGDTIHMAEGRPGFNSGGYATSGSDHEPDTLGVVCALDISADIAPGYTSDNLAHVLAATNDPRIDYIISHSQIYSSREGAEPFGWHPYSGSDPHVNHCHISVRHGPAFTDNTGLWYLGQQVPAPQPQPQPEKKMDHVWIGYVEGSAGRYIIGAGTKHHIGSPDVYNEWKAQAQLRGLDVLERPCTQAFLDDLTNV